MMLGEKNTSADYGEKCGEDALTNRLIGVIIMVGFPIPLHQFQNSVARLVALSADLISLFQGPT